MSAELTPFINPIPADPKMVSASTYIAEHVACGAYHTIVLMQDGSLYITGSNGYTKTTDNCDTDVLTLIPNNTGKIPKYIACGALHTVVLMKDGSLYGIGDNGYGQLGLGLGLANIGSTGNV